MSYNAARLESIRHLYPFDSHFLDVGGARMHYIDEGAGPAIVFVHGNPTWSFYFRELVKGLCDRYRVIVPDHVGCGLSDKPAKYPYTLSKHADNLGLLIESLGLQEVTLAGHDWGGAIAFGWATRNVRRVRRLVVFNTAAFLGGRTPRRIRVCGWPMVGEVAVRGLNLFARAAIRMACKRHERMTKDVAAGYLLPYDRYANRVAVLRFVRDIPHSPRQASHRELSRIESSLNDLRGLPMIVFWGGQDFCFDDTFLAEWMRRFPDARVHRFADAGHYVVEDAHQRILALLRDFLLSTDSPRSVQAPVDQQGWSPAAPKSCR
ncbi:MAG: alpha/beta fold hydrolase [Planctomycetota bacterium]